MHSYLFMSDSTLLVMDCVPLALDLLSVSVVLSIILHSHLTHPAQVDDLSNDASIFIVH